MIVWIMIGINKGHLKGCPPCLGVC